MKNFLFSFHLIFFSVGIAIAMSTDVVIKNEVTVEKSNVELGDVGNIANPEIAGLVLDSAPAPGESAVWSAAEISKRLRPYQSALKDIHFKIPKFIKIVRGDSSFNEKILKEKITSMLQSTLPSPGWEVTLKDIQNVQPPEMTPTTKWHVVPLAQRPHGPAQFEIVMEDQGKALSHIWLNGHVEYSANVAVVQKTLAARSKINGTDIVWEKRNMTFATELPATKSDLEGSVGRSAFSAGNIIYKSNLDRELALKFGEEVEVKAGGDDFFVSTRAVAQQNGYVGDVVKVRVINGQRTLTGTIVAKGLIQVVY